MRSKRNRTDEGPAQPGRSADRGPLRVLLLITRAEPGGAQVHLLELCRGLLGRVELSVGVGQEGPDDNPFLVEALRSIGVTVEVLPDLRRAVAPRADRAALAALRALIRARRPHLVHTHSSKAGLLGRLAARLEGVPAVHTAHAWSFSDGLPWRQRGPAIPIEALAACWTRRFIVVSEADREIALRFGVARAEQVRVVHNGVPEVIPRARPSADGAPVIGMVARLAAPKDPLTLLRALAPLRVPYRLDLIGDGPERPAVVAEVQALGLGARVRMLGDRRDVPELLAGMQVFTLVSRQEGFPLVILEAMRAGLPVVASDVGGVREAVAEGVTGALVARGDVAGLRAAFLRLLSDPGLRARQGQAGRQAWERRFTAARMIEATLNIYGEIAAEDGLPLPRAGSR